MNTVTQISPTWWLWSLPHDGVRWQELLRALLRYAQTVGHYAGHCFSRVLPLSAAAVSQTQEETVVIALCVEEVPRFPKPSPSLDAKKVSTSQIRSATMPELCLVGVYGSLIQQRPLEWLLSVRVPRAPPL